jgi:hypothetical protein
VPHHGSQGNSLPCGVGVCDNDGQGTGTRITGDNRNVRNSPTAVIRQRRRQGPRWALRRLSVPMNERQVASKRNAGVNVGVWVQSDIAALS